ncbi:MAG TPA: hypothetical protein VL326_14035 [Kofleriaceae bacterium]|jgi:hypothetical protein|nr:hypothetical protein [Kofleriaceae bacterium]
MRGVVVGVRIFLLVCVLGACAEPSIDDELGTNAQGVVTLGEMKCGYDELANGILLLDKFCVTFVTPEMTDPGLTCAEGRMGCDFMWPAKCKTPDDCHSGVCNADSFCEGPFKAKDTYAPNDAHFVGAPLSLKGHKSKLLVFLPGKGGIPEHAYMGDLPDGSNNDNSGLLNVAASQGYRVIGLGYFNGGGPGSVSDGSFMREVVTGVDCNADIYKACERLPYVHTRHDTIMFRLVKLLEYLRDNQPGWGWDDYLVVDLEHGDPDEGHLAPNWPLITVIGFSNGSSYAAWMGLNFPISRIALLNGPNDGKFDPAGWIPAAYFFPPYRQIDEPWRFYGLVSTENHAVKGTVAEPVNELGFFEVSRSWDMLGMNGAVEFNPDPGTDHNFDDAQRLYSDEEQKAYDVLGRPDSATAQIGDELDNDAAHQLVVTDTYDFKNSAGVGVGPNASKTAKQNKSDCNKIRKIYPLGPNQTAEHLCRVGYHQAWRHIIGDGSFSEASPQPH